MKFQAIKGVRDILPPESALWNRVEQAARDVFHTYGYGEIRLPIFEPTELFARSVGLDTDIVSKEMYSFEDKPSDVPDPTIFVDLPDYVRAVEVAINRGDIPNTTSNRQAVKALLEKFDAFAKSAQELRAGFAAGPPLTPTYRSLLFECIFFAQNVQLGEMLSLRPEATASVVRAYIEPGMHSWPGNVKLYYVGPMFRRERPQKGRYRQFYQIGAELLGSSDHAALDAEVI